MCGFDRSVLIKIGRCSCGGDSLGCLLLWWQGFVLELLNLLLLLLIVGELLLLWSKVVVVVVVGVCRVEFELWWD
jgi:hypothetical protein